MEVHWTMLNWLFKYVFFLMNRLLVWCLQCSLCVSFKHKNTKKAEKGKKEKKKTSVGATKNVIQEAVLPKQVGFKPHNLPTTNASQEDRLGRGDKGWVSGGWRSRSETSGMSHRQPEREREVLGMHLCFCCMLVKWCLCCIVLTQMKAPNVFW